MYYITFRKTCLLGGGGGGGRGQVWWTFCGHWVYIVLITNKHDDHNFDFVQKEGTIY